MVNSFIAGPHITKGILISNFRIQTSAVRSVLHTNFQRLFRPLGGRVRAQHGSDQLSRVYPPVSDGRHYRYDQRWENPPSEAEASVALAITGQPHGAGVKVVDGAEGISRLLQHEFVPFEAGQNTARHFLFRKSVSHFTLMLNQNHVFQIPVQLRIDLFMPFFQ